MFLKTCLFLCAICYGNRNVLGNITDRPNIVVIMADDMGIDDVSFRGAKQFLTPNIDSLAYYGKILNNLRTPPMCTPSRAAFLTGLYPIHTGTQHFVLSNEEPWGILENFTNLPEILQSQGYATNLIGKWHMGMARQEYTPNHNGFDYFVGYLGGFVGYYQMRSKMPTNFSMGYDFRRNMDVECLPAGSYLTDFLTEEAVSVIMRHKAEQPLFLMVNHLAPHAGNEDAPLEAPQEEIQKFRHIADERKRIFAAMISKLDESVGKIIKALDNKNLLKNSIILFTSDNGAPTQGLFSNTGSNWPLRGQKNSPWEGALRVPGVIWSPLIKHKSSLYQPIMDSSDWLPTLAAAAKIPLNSLQLKLDGINHWSSFQNPASNSFSPAFIDREIVHMLDDIEEVTAFSKGQFKYIKGTTINGDFDHVLSTRQPNETDPRELDYVNVIKNSIVSKVLAKYESATLTSDKIMDLRSQAEIKCGNLEMPCKPQEEECLFDIWQDPCENNNLAQNPEYKEILEDMKRRLDHIRPTAIEPRTGGSIIDYDPTRHDCTWTYYLEEPVRDYILECDYHSPPCPLGY